MIPKSSSSIVPQGHSLELMHISKKEAFYRAVVIWNGFELSMLLPESHSAKEGFLIREGAIISLVSTILLSPFFMRSNDASDFTSTMSNWVIVLLTTTALVIAREQQAYRSLMRIQTALRKNRLDPELKKQFTARELAYLRSQYAPKAHASTLTKTEREDPSILAYVLVNVFSAHDFETFMREFLESDHSKVHLLYALPLVFKPTYQTITCKEEKSSSQKGCTLSSSFESKWLYFSKALLSIQIPLFHTDGIKIRQIASELPVKTQNITYFLEVLNQALVENKIYCSGENEYGLSQVFYNSLTELAEDGKTSSKLPSV